VWPSSILGTVSGLAGHVADIGAVEPWWAWVLSDGDGDLVPLATDAASGRSEVLGRASGGSFQIARQVLQEFPDAHGGEPGSSPGDDIEGFEQSPDVVVPAGVRDLSRIELRETSD
jgi:hypothetical protein